MKSIGIITIHKINNYGSVFQAFALQQTFEKLGHQTEIIDYLYPNVFQLEHGIHSAPVKVSLKDKILKYFYAFGLLRQHKGIAAFVHRYQHLSKREYQSPDELKKNPPAYDIYVTGSDQLWNPNYCSGDPSFFLDFAPVGKKRVAYAASFGVSSVGQEYATKFSAYLNKYSNIGVRENSGVKLVEELTGRTDTEVVLDPTLLLNKEDWMKIAVPQRLVKEKYILCYYLNYSFDSFPYVDDLAAHIQKITGYKLVKVARPPRHFYEANTSHQVGASPEEFLALVRDAELVLTTSFHGTAFAVNFEKPLFSVVANRKSSDSRQLSLLENVGLSDRVLEMGEPFPDFPVLSCDYSLATQKLAALRDHSIQFLKNALEQ